MQLPDEGSLPRREFLRRSAMGAAVLAAIGGGVAHGGAGSVLAQLAADPVSDLPTQPVSAVGVLDEAVVAVGGVRGRLVSGAGPRSTNPGSGSLDLRRSRPARRSPVSPSIEGESSPSVVWGPTTPRCRRCSPRVTCVPGRSNRAWAAGSASSPVSRSRAGGV